MIVPIENDNAHAHPNMRDQKSQELRWRSLNTLLKEEDGMHEEHRKYSFGQFFSYVDGGSRPILAELLFGRFNGQYDFYLN